MKVVQINAVYQYSSTGRMVTEMHNALKERGDDSAVFCTNLFEPKNNIFTIGDKLDYKIHAFCSRFFGLQGYFSRCATKKLLRKLDVIKPDVIHLHNLHSNFINLPLLVSYLAQRDIATVVTLHDCWFFTGHCCHYTEDQCDKWLSGCGQCPALRKYNNSWFLDRTHRVYRDKKRLFGAIPRLAIVGNSEWTTAQARRSLLKTANIVERIYNWINLSIFYPRVVEKNSTFSILGVAQGWSEKKGLSIFVKLAEHFPDCRVVLVGGVEEPVKLPENIEMVGVLSSADKLAEYYSMADVFVTASIQETFGNVSAEALACGTPLVVNNATANPELAGEGCGYIADNSDINSYIKAIEAIRENGKVYYSNKCIAFARANFNMRTNIAEYIKLYERVQW